MKKLLLVVCVLLLIAATMPPILPSSFWGHVDGLTAGQVITAKIKNSDTPIARTKVIEWEGDTYYSFILGGVPSDEGKTVVFKRGGVLLGKGVWHSGTNVELNLSVP